MNRNPNNISAGDVVTLAPRRDGIPHRDGNDAKWEVVTLNDLGLALLHLVGGDSGRTAGAAASALTKVRS